ncbi:MAG: DUF1573 domain-containing protein [Bacteroidota bacterium]|jgi:hypothetical protein
MKKIISLILISGVLISCSPDKKSEKVDASDVNVSQTANGTKSGSLPEIKFDESVHDFGKITQGERVKTSFVFMNSGKSNLIISNVSTTCGCTVADYPKDPIAPGKGGKIEVEFNSEGKSGNVERKVTVVSNCEPNSTTLTIKSTVIVPESKYSNEVK